MKSFTIKITLVIIVGLFFSCNQKKAVGTEKNSIVQAPKSIEVLVGTYTSGESKGIYKLAFNPINGVIINKGLVAEIENPSYLTLSNDKKRVYAIGENEKGSVSVFQWNKERTKLELEQQLLVQGMHPCYININSTEKMLSIANYSSGNVSFFKMDIDGAVLESPQIRTHDVSSIINPQQEKPHAHCSKFSRDGKFLFVADLGIDEIVGYAIDENNDLSQKFIALKMDAGDGPRHFVFHPTKDIMYVVNEISNTIIVAALNQITGKFTKIQKQTALPQDFEGASYGGDIQISEDARFLYATNRGHNSIAIFSISDEGMLKLIGTESVRGDWPRNFTLSPKGDFLLVANQKSNNITVFEVNKKTGLLIFTGNELALDMPVCIKF